MVRLVKIILVGTFIFGFKTAFAYKEVEENSEMQEMIEHSKEKVNEAFHEANSYHYNQFIKQGDNLYNQGQYKKALEKYVEAEKVIYKHPKVHLKKANCLKKLGRYKESEQEEFIAKKIAREGRD